MAADFGGHGVRVHKYQLDNGVAVTAETTSIGCDVSDDPMKCKYKRGLLT